ncbi:MAG: hypothetical protein P4K94_02990 [Terracidiphilus sp.]|nr:hypothetical protein [Terracidiphilus sp.]
MVRANLRQSGWGLSAWFCACLLVPAQPQPPPAQLTETGKVVFAGDTTPYLIRRLPVSSFPYLPAAIQDQLNLRGCLIPQTYQARRPENVVHASLERNGSSDWAVLCSVRGTVSLLVFFDSSSAPPAVLATAPETERLQVHDTSGVLGFNWGIDPASPEQIHEAQSSMEHRPPRLDHDALADSVVDRRTVYHFYSKSAWTLVALEE